MELKLRFMQNTFFCLLFFFAAERYPAGFNTDSLNSVWSETTV